MHSWRSTLTGLIVATFAVAATPGASAQTAPAGANRVAYALMDGSNSIAVIDLAQRRLAARIEVPGNPHGGAITPDGRFIYAASMGGNTVHVVDTRARKVVATIDVGGITHHATASPDGRYVYMAGPTVIAIDTATNKIVARIPTEDPPFYLAFSPDGGRLYALGMGNSIAVIDPVAARVMKTIRMNATSMMGHLVVRPDGKELYVTNDANDTVTVIDVETGRPVAQISVGEGPHGAATTVDGRYVVVGNRGQTDVSVIDTQTKKVVETREIGQRPEHLIATPDGRYLLVGRDTGANTLLLIDPTSFETLASIDLWKAPHTILVPERSADQAARDRGTAVAADDLARAGGLD